MSSAIPKIALPAQGILGAQIRPQNPREAVVQFDDPMHALRFSSSIREELRPKSSQYHHVVINEELGERSFAQHFVLITTEDADPAACAQHMAATLYSGDDEDAQLPTLTDRGYLVDGYILVNVIKQTPLNQLEGQAMARHLPVVHSEDMRMNQRPAQVLKQASRE